MAEKSMFQPASVGRMVHFKLNDGPHKGEYRPAIVVRVWGPKMVNLQVFTDGQELGNSNDGLPSPLWVTSSEFGEGERQWVWPPYVPSILAEEA